MQFPSHCAFSNNCCTLSRLDKSLANPEIYCKWHDADVAMPFDKTIWTQPLTNQHIIYLHISVSFPGFPLHRSGLGIVLGTGLMKAESDLKFSGKGKEFPVGKGQHYYKYPNV